MWPFKKRGPEKWALPRVYTLFLENKPPMQFPTQEDLIALHRKAVEDKDPLLTLIDEEGNPCFQCKTSLIDAVVLGFAQQEKVNGGPKQLQS